MVASSRDITRIRHDTKLRQVMVKQVRRITPKTVRVTLAGVELAGFGSEGFDDHVKVFFPVDEELAARPRNSHREPIGGMPDRSLARDFTPHGFDPVANEIALDFTLHGTGIAASWAATAQVGQMLGLGGPRGSFIIPCAWDWYLLVGDESALPAIARRLAELPSNARALVVVEVDDADECQLLPTAAVVETTWVLRRTQPETGADGLVQALRALHFPDGDYYVWAAGESSSMKMVREYLLTERGSNRHWMKVAAYWKRGMAAHHEKLGE